MKIMLSLVYDWEIITEKVESGISSFLHLSKHINHQPLKPFLIVKVVTTGELASLPPLCQTLNNSSGLSFKAGLVTEEIKVCSSRAGGKHTKTKLCLSVNVRLVLQ